MKLSTKARVLTHMVKYRLTWNRRDINYRTTEPVSDKFLSPMQAVNLIQDSDTVIVCGIGGNQRISVLSWALRERFEKTRHPQNLTLISAGGHGGRGKAPGTLEEWALDGLVNHFVCAHFETYKAILALADEGKVTLDCIPLGIMALLVKAAASGDPELITSTGVGTFCDPRCGVGSSIMDSGREGLISVAGDDLRYRLPRIDVAIFNAPAADSEGNIYVENCTTLCESKEAALAAKRHNGRVIVNVGNIVPKQPEKIFLSAEHVDAVVLNPVTEQTATIKHSKPLMYLTENNQGDPRHGLEKVKFMNRIAGITPTRGKAELRIAEQCATLLVDSIPKNSLINIGTGLPELVCETLLERGALSDYTLFTEAGAVGGIPAPGMFFGAAIGPKRIISSPEVFELANEKLDATVLGFLQVDSEGNVNSSKRGEGAINYVGPGGFIDLSCAARNIFFVGAWMTKGKVVIRDGETRIKKYGTPKFVDEVDQVTFSGKEALKAGKNVYYVTDVGTFKLTKDGLVLVQMRAGIDVQRDILEFSLAKVSVAAHKRSLH